MHLLISLVSHNHLRMLRTQAFFVTIFSIIFHGFLAKANRLPDSTYEACKPINCGVGPDIKYPFYIVDSQDTCGYPGFEVVCKENRPVYQITGSEYIIKDIHYGNQSFRLVNYMVLNSTCIAPRTNFSFERSSFKFDPNFGNLLLFYYFDITFPEKYTQNPIACVSSKNHSSYAILDDGREFIDSSAMPCQEFVVAPVEMDGLEENLDKVDYVKLLKDGFTLTWPGFSCSSCEKSGGYCGVVNEESVCFCPDRPHRENCYDEESHRNKKVILIPVFGAIILILSLTLVAVFVLWRRKKGGWHSSRFFPRNTSLDLSLKRDLEQDSKYLGIPVFSYSELQEATNNFDCSKELGDGGFGTVYYGKLLDGREVAVKRLYEHNTKRTEQFRNEIEILASLRHRSLVTLYGYTSRRSNKLLLVYEYIPNGTVADHLHGERATDGLLTWPIRMNIAVETASALAYLHASGIIHRDVKTNNILLDENFCVKVADFGLSRHCPSGATHISTAPQGTAGYVDPEYHEFYQLTDKSDVYSFGVVLIELISSMPAVDITRDRHEINLSNLAMNRIVRHAFDELIDPSLGFETDGEVMRMTSSVAELAFRCLQPEKDMRPTMDEVLETLKGIQGGDLNSKVEAETGKNSDVSGTVEVHPSPELEDSILLKGIRLAVSPISVTDKWVSHSSTSTSNSR